MRLFLKHPGIGKPELSSLGQLYRQQLLSIGSSCLLRKVVVENKKRGDPCPKLVHKTNSAVVDQYAFHYANIPFLSPPVNRVSPSSETDSEQEGFLYHAGCQGESRHAKSLNCFFLGPSQLTWSSSWYWMVWPARLHLLRLPPCLAIWQQDSCWFPGVHIPMWPGPQGLPWVPRASMLFSGVHCT